MEEGHHNDYLLKYFIHSTLIILRRKFELSHNQFVDLIILDILDNSAGEFEDTEEVYEAVGEVLQGISEKSEDDIR